MTKSNPDKIRNNEESVAEHKMGKKNELITNNGD